MMIHMPHAGDSPTWLGMLGVVAPILVAIFIWGAKVESHNAKVDLGQEVLRNELVRLSTRMDTLTKELDRVKEQR